MPILIATVAVIGLVVGRGIVAETTAHRMGLPDNWWRPECGTCGGSLTWTMARCTPNRHRQRWTTPAIPAVNAALFAIMAVASPSLWVLPAYLVFSTAMLTLTITDFETKLIPNRILGPATAIGAVLLVAGSIVAGQLPALGNAAIGAFAYFGAMFALGYLARGALGFGDVKMSFIIGLFTGYVSLGTVVVAGVGAFIGRGDRWLCSSS